ncbi:hypothetical protein [Blautia producta]|uniref:hypothetical protein n=1 Tax=Blautia producta TaxID=33035 RepID=UPI00210B93E4|nr:hypothetical protein [Blautia producta]MCQ4744174.1 hypothetical protein [Blautia producta]
MKKGFRVFLLLVVCLGIHVTDVSADLIFEPQNAFYKLHANKCEYVNHTYTVNGYGGKTELYKSPLSDKVMAVMKNNEEHYISYVYTDEKGNKWGLVEDSENKEGWVTMVYMFTHYCGDSFLEEYKSQIKKEEGSIDIDSGEKIYYFAYPGSGDPFNVNNVKMEGHSLNYDRVFTDEEGLKWAYVNYYYQGWHTFWICMDDPSNSNLPVREVDNEMPEPPESIDRVGGGITVSVWLVAGLVAVVMMVTGCLIWGTYGKRGKL